LRSWPLRATDVDLHGHVNNAVHWAAVEGLLGEIGVNPRLPMRAELDYRLPLDAGDALELVVFEDGGSGAVAFVANGADVCAVARVGPLEATDPRTTHDPEPRES
jgi:acyl-ACP thioesterase